MLKWLDKLDLVTIALPAIVLGLAPFHPEPHLLEKLKMLFAGTLSKPVDIFDLFMHGAGPVLLIIWIIRKKVLKISP